MKEKNPTKHYTEGKEPNQTLHRRKRTPPNITGFFSFYVMFGGVLFLYVMFGGVLFLLYNVWWGSFKRTPPNIT
jgi:hypothetical protein